MPFAHTDDGIRIAYETQGNGGLKIVLLHGWGGSASYWRDLVSHLNLEGLQLIAPSYRGHGIPTNPQRVTLWMNSPRMCSLLPIRRKRGGLYFSASA